MHVRQTLVRTPGKLCATYILGNHTARFQSQATCHIEQQLPLQRPFRRTLLSVKLLCRRLLQGLESRQDAGCKLARRAAEPRLPHKLNTSQSLLEHESNQWTHRCFAQECHRSTGTTCMSLATMLARKAVSFYLGKPRLL